MKALIYDIPEIDRAVCLVVCDLNFESNCLQSYFTMNQRTVNVAYYKTGLIKFKDFNEIDQWTQDQQNEYLLNASYEAHLYSFFELTTFLLDFGV